MAPRPRADHPRGPVSGRHAGELWPMCGSSLLASPTATIQRGSIYHHHPHPALLGGLSPFPPGTRRRTDAIRAHVVARPFPGKRFRGGIRLAERWPPARVSLPSPVNHLGAITRCSTTMRNARITLTGQPDRIVDSVCLLSLTMVPARRHRRAAMVLFGAYERHGSIRMGRGRLQHPPCIGRPRAQGRYCGGDFRHRALAVRSPWTAAGDVGGGAHRVDCYGAGHTLIGLALAPRAARNLTVGCIGCGPVARGGRRAAFC